MQPKQNPNILEQILALIPQLLRLCAFQAGPQHLPYSPRLLIVLVTLGTLLSAGMLQMLPQHAYPELRAVLGSAYALAAPYLLLAARQRTNRFVQTATATTGVGIILSLLAVPAFAALSAGASPDEVAPTVLLWLLALLIWGVVLMAHILRNALEVSQWSAVLLALLYYAGATAVDSLL